MRKKQKKKKDDDDDEDYDYYEEEEEEGKKGSLTVQSLHEIVVVLAMARPAHFWTKFLVSLGTRGGQEEADRELWRQRQIESSERHGSVLFDVLIMFLSLFIGLVLQR